MKKINHIKIFLLLFLTLITKAYSHSLGEGYVYVKILENRIEGHFELTLNDLNDALGLDQNKDGKVNNEELTANLESIKSYIRPRFKLWIHDSPVLYRYTTHDIMKDSNAKFLMLHFVTDDYESVPDLLGIDYTLFFDMDSKQRGLLVVRENVKTGVIDNLEKVSLIFTPAKPHQKLDVTATSLTKQFFLFIGQGIWHIWIGMDHILFIMVLILISVVTRDKGIWKGVPKFGTAFLNLIKIISLFTIAHSITLCLAALGFIQLSSRIVESTIAASVVLACINNMFPIFGKKDWLIIFCFGLFHGLGFASVLGDLIVQKQSLLVALLGFNVGVELGQLAIVCAAFPIFFLLRMKKLYSFVFIRSGSVVIGLIALVWFAERAFKLEPILQFF